MNQKYPKNDLAGTQSEQSDTKDRLAEVSSELMHIKAMYQNLLHHLSDEVHLWKLLRDENGSIKTWILEDANTEALKSWGKEKASVIGKSTNDIFGYDATSQFMPIIEKIFETQQPYTWVKYFEPTNQYLSMSSIPMGEYFLSTGKDITEEKLAEIELRESRQLLHRTEIISNQGSWKYDIQNDSWSFSDNWFNLFGVDKNMDINQLADLVDPRDRDRVHDAFKNAIKGEPYNVEHRINGTSESTRWVHVIAELIMDDYGKPISLIGATRDITQEKQAQKALEESEEFLNRTGDIAKVGGWQFYPIDGRYLLSEVALEIHEVQEDYKFPLEEALAFYHPDDREMVGQHVREAIEEGKPYTFEARFISGKGNHKWVLAKGIPEMHNGKCVRLSGIIQDITEQKKIAYRVNMLTNTLDYALNGFDIVNHEGKYIYVNQAFCKMFGYEDPVELIGTSPEARYADPSMPAHVIDQLQKNGEYVFEIKSKRKDGSLFDVLMYARLDYDEDGNEIYPTSCIDITDRLNHENELAESKEKFEMLFKYSPMAKLLADEQGNYIDANDEACELLGYSRKELTSFTVNDLVAVEHTDPELRYNEFTKKGEESGQVTLVRKDGEQRIVEYHAKKISPDRYLSSFIDITEKLEVEAEKKRIQQEYKNIADSIPGVVLKYKLNTDGTDELLYISQGARDLFEVDPEEAINDVNLIWNRIDPEDIKQMIPSIQKSADELSVWEFQYRMHLPSGKTKWMNLKGVPEKAENGSVVWNTVGLDITQRVEAEKELEQVNANLEAMVEERAEKAIKLSKELERYWLVAEHAKSGIWRYDVRTNGLEWDSIMYDLFGIDEDEFSGAYEAWESSLHPDDVADNVRALQETIATGKYLDILFRIIHGKTGEIRYIRGKGKVETDLQGNTIAVFGTNWDVTQEMELAQERDQIIRELERYWLVAEHAKSGVWRYDVVTKDLEWDNTMYEVFGVDKDKFSGTYDDWVSCLHPEDAEKAIQDLNETIALGEDLYFLFRIIHGKTGEIRHIRGRGKAEKDSKGNTIALFGTNWDVTEEIELANERERIIKELEIYQMAAKNAEVGVWVFEIEKGLSKYDDTLYNMYEIDKAEYPNHVPYEVWESALHPDDRDRIAGLFYNTIQNKGTLDALFKIITKKSKQVKYIRAKGKVALDNNGNVQTAFGTNWDVTKEMTLVEEREKAIEELREAQSKLIQAEKMASLGVLTAGVAHELNNPLNFIIGGYTVIQQELENNKGRVDIENLKEYLDWIKTGSDRASKIVKSLNLFSRSNDNNTEVCDLHQILDDCLLMLYNKYKDRIEIKKNYAHTELKITGNNGKLHQALLNILSNAIDAIPKEGEITVETKIHGDDCIILIVDNGMGIQETDIKKVTDPFYTTKPPGKGTGLGLSITNSIIQEHNGHLKITSKVDEGTQVSISLTKNKKNGA